MSTLFLEEIARRRTFGIVSHPDAGKTTLTEKLLLFGGAIQVAGAVKAKKATRHATSDFMEIERQRGISVATSVMGFEYGGFKINLLDTPGHEDFCEDTYRTLTAVDSALMVIDAAKGVEAQTFKLLDVCRMRHTPVMTFINKMDRETQEPLGLLDEIEQRLNMTICPITWPIGSGKSFKGVYKLLTNEVVLYRPHATHQSDDAVVIRGVADPTLDKMVGDELARILRDEVAFIQGVTAPFNQEAYQAGSLTPVFFGCALNNFGVKELLDFFINHAPPPQPRETDRRMVLPDESQFSGFVFKIHANIDPKHRDRIAFVRICSGTFERNQRVLNVASNKIIRCANPTAFMAQEKDIIDVAYPGDIVGLHDTGSLKIGDTLSEGEVIQFKGIPHFSPELFRACVNLNPLKTKQLQKGLLQLCEEGVAQLFTLYDGRKVIGTVGALQFEVIQYRLEHEYGAQCRFDPLGFVKACWVVPKADETIDRLMGARRIQMATDVGGKVVYMAQTRWGLDRDRDEFKEVEFRNVSDG